MTTAAPTIEARAGTTSFAGRTGALTSTWLLGLRELRNVLRAPDVLIPSLLIPVFIYFVTIGMFQGFAEQFGIDSFPAFLLPVAVLFAVHNGSAGQNLVADIDAGYFDKLLTTPIRRSALLIGSMVGDLVRIVLQTCLVIAVALVVSPMPPTGWLGITVLLALGVSWGTAFAAIGYGVALRTGSPQATQSTFMLFFPFVFLSPAFAPREAMDELMATAVAINPLTHVLEGMRSLVVDGWDASALLIAAAVIVTFGLCTFTLLIAALRTRLT
jgi:ABC-2 type transport system permease protein